MDTEQQKYNSLGTEGVHIISEGGLISSNSCLFLKAQNVAPPRGDCFEIEKLPRDIIQEICSHMDALTFAALSQTNKAFYALGSQPKTWEAFLKKDYPYFEKHLGFKQSYKIAHLFRNPKETALKRLAKEVRSQFLAPSPFITVNLIDDNLYKWHASFVGPPDTPYEGGTFLLLVIFPHDYPNNPPTITFITKIFHVNISEKGKICLSILDKNWSPIYSAAACLNAIHNLLRDPNPDDPVGTQIGELFTKEPLAYAARARKWTDKYAQTEF